MRLFVILLLSATPAAAWEFAPDPVCTIRGGDDVLGVTVTFDPRTALYRIALRRPAGWAAAPGFAIRFEGGAGRTITTDRQVVAGDTLSVSDRGFGNVLDGMALNDRAIVLSGDTALPVDLDGAAGPVAAFRACVGAPSV